MLRKCVVWWMTILLTLACALTACAESVTVHALVNLPKSVKLTFEQEHPGVKLADDVAYIDAVSADQLIGQFLTGTCNLDLFTVNTAYFDVKQLMRKGYCLDLSDEPELAAQVQQMWPMIAEQLMVDGKLYAVPVVSQFNCVMAQQETFERLGFDETDVPQTFSELLDFLEAWIIRMEDEPENIGVFGAWDEEYYRTHKEAYAIQLTTMLLEQVMLQCQYAKKDIHFDMEELPALLERAREIGLSLHEIEPVYINGRPILFDIYASFDFWSDAEQWQVGLKLHENQPKLVEGSLALAMGRADTQAPQAVKELLALQLANLPREHDKAFFYQDAGPIEAAQYTAERTYIQALIHVVDGTMQNPHATMEDCVPEFAALTAQQQESVQTWYQEMHSDYDEEAMQAQLARWKQKLENETGRWAVSPAAWRAYAACADRLFFPAPTQFSAGDGLTNFRTLIKRFACGQITGTQLVQTLNHIQQMMQQEAQ